jgi:hypothetical protein
MRDLREIPVPPEEELGYSEKAGETAPKAAPSDDPGDDGSE